MDARQTLKRYFGFDDFKPNQEQVVAAVCAGRDVLAVMPTGAGKSICYQVPALMMDGMALVISPLISLMKDQVMALQEAGIPAAFLNSSLTGGQQAQVLQEAGQGAIKLLYVSPERLEMPGFADFCAEHCPSMIAVDEAHCISQWGQDFRPSYTRINDFIDGLPQRPGICAFTATATKRVRDDIAAQLCLASPLVVVSSFDRPNLSFEVRTPQNKKRELLKLVEARPDACGIVYCTSRKGVEEVCDFLNESGVSATRYHAGLGDEERRRNQEDFIYDRKRVMVATNAFGMGIDKSNVGFVIHYNLPLDLESYYQEAGRAGRDGEPASCVLLYAPKDVHTCEFLLNAGFEENAQIDAPTRHMLLERARERLKLMTFYATTADCLRAYILRYFGEHPAPSCGNCGNCLRGFEEVDATVDAQKVISCVYRLGQRNQRAGRATIVKILRGSKDAVMAQRGYDTLSTYGIMAETGTDRITAVVDQLLSLGMLVSTDGDYPVIEPTDKAAAFLREKGTLMMKVPKKREASQERRAKGLAKRDAIARGLAAGGGKPGKGGEGAFEEGELDAGLFAVLKDLRMELAVKQNVPAYVVFSNHTLHDMCRRRPTTIDELLEVSGVGETKAERYGEEFLAAIREYDQ